MKPSVLVIDDEKTFRIVVEEALSADGFDVSSASNGEAGLRACSASRPISSSSIATFLTPDGVKLLEELVGEARERNVDTLVVMATAYADVASSVQGIEARRIRLPDQTRPFAGAHRDLSQCARSSAPSKPGSKSRLPGEGCAGRSRAGRIGSHSRRRPDGREGRGVGRYDVLIQGESGTGKELVAGLIHQKHGTQPPTVHRNQLRVASENLLESELFGYEKGAFTDAKAQKRGLFEAADQGTLFLDEIGEMRPGTQAKLLKVLEEMTFRRLGGTRDLKVDLRVIAATNKDLAARSSAGRFASTSTTDSTSSTCACRRSETGVTTFSLSRASSSRCSLCE